MSENLYPPDFAADDQALARRLFGANSFSKFIEEQWLLNSGLGRWIGNPDDLCSWRELLGLYAEGWTAKTVRRSETGEHVEDGMRSEPRQVGGLEQLEGKTVCMEKIQSGLPRLAQLCRGLKLLLGLCGEVIVNAYLSGADQGFGWHFDAADVFIVQLLGQKQWHFGTQPALRHPLKNCLEADLSAYRQRSPWVNVPPPAEFALATTTLHAGDVLYLPAGTWHRTAACGVSVALTVTCTRTAVLHEFTRMLQQTFAPEPSWRQLPSGVHGLQKVSEFYEQRLLELREWVQRLEVSDLVQTWMSGLADIPALALGTPVESTDVFCRTAALVWPVIDRQHVVLFAPGRRTRIPENLWPCVRDLLERDSVQVEDVCSLDPDLDPGSARALLSTLSRLGALSPARSVRPETGEVFE